MGGSSPLWQLTLARFRERLRQPEVLFWVFAFPLLLAVALGLAFRNRPPEVIRVAVEAGRGADSVAALLNGAGGLHAAVSPPARAAEQLRKGSVTLVVVPGEPLVYRFDSTRSESRLARLATDDALQRALGRRDVRAVAEQKVMARGSRYIDFLIPGLLGLNLMGTGMWGMGYAVVEARKRKLMKRLLASPMRRSQYLLSFIVARLVMLGLMAAVYLAAFKGLGKKYFAALLVMSIFLDYNSVLYSQYPAWVAPLVPLVFLDFLPPAATPAEIAPESSPPGIAVG